MQKFANASHLAHCLKPLPTPASLCSFTPGSLTVQQSRAPAQCQQSSSCLSNQLFFFFFSLRAASSMFLVFWATGVQIVETLSAYSSDWGYGSWALNRHHVSTLKNFTLPAEYSATHFCAGFSFRGVGKEIPSYMGNFQLLHWYTCKKSSGEDE